MRGAKPADAPDFRQSPRASNSAAAVVFEHVSFAFDDHVVLSDISFTIAKGSMKMLLGASGSGKSVVLKLILGLLRPDHRDDGRRRDREVARPGARDVDRGDTSDP
jgi:ABC-type bacteriocin/lantibiotic exporter with double-glycine peptidase domain